MTPIGSKINDSQKRKIGLPWFVFSNHQSLTSPPNSTPASPAKTAIIPEICAITLLSKPLSSTSQICSKAAAPRTM